MGADAIVTGKTAGALASMFRRAAIQSQMEPTDYSRRRRSMTIFWRTMAVTLCTIRVIHSSPDPRFDVAAIKLCSPSDNAALVPGGRGGGGNYSTSPGRLHVHCMSVEAKTEDAVANGPTTSASPARKLMTGPMLRALLEDRFHLKTRREAEDTLVKLAYTVDDPLINSVQHHNGRKKRAEPNGRCDRYSPVSFCAARAVCQGL